MKMRSAALALALAGLAVGPAFAADQKDSVIANVNGSEVRLSALADFARQMGPQAAQAPYEVMLEVAINNQLVLDAARKEKMENDPEVKATLKKVEAQLLANAYMKKKVRPAVTDEALKARYDQAAKGFQPQEEVRARHILTETEEQARAVIADLGRGIDFAELARTKSKDTGSGAQGGDLGYFTAKDMVPEFSAAAFAMRPGEVSKAAVKSQFGYHVIKVEDKRMGALPPFEQAKPAIAAQLADEVQQKLVSDLREKAKIKRFNVDGTPMADKK